jgi:hypothetical protein
MIRPSKTQVVFNIGPEPKRDGLVISLPKPLNHKDFKALQSAIHDAAWKTLTSRHRRRRNRK